MTRHSLLRLLLLGVCLIAASAASLLAQSADAAAAAPAGPAAARYRGAQPWTMRAGITYQTGTLRYSSPWEDALSFDLPGTFEGAVDVVYRSAGRALSFQWSGGAHLGVTSLHATVSAPDGAYGELPVVNSAVDETYYNVGVQTEAALVFGSLSVRPGLLLGASLGWFDRIKATGTAKKIDGTTMDYDIESAGLVPSISAGGLLQYAQRNRVWFDVAVRYTAYLESILSNSEITMKPDGFSASFRLYFW